MIFIKHIYDLLGTLYKLFEKSFACDVNSKSLWYEYKFYLKPFPLPLNLFSPVITSVVYYLICLCSKVAYIAKYRIVISLKTLCICVYSVH